jgi:hypothetical protein
MIDKTICLSLSHREDRRIMLEDNKPSFIPEIEYFPAFTPKTCIVPGSWPHLPSYYATTLGHIRILEKLWLDKNWSTCLILEDDALFLNYADYLPYFLSEIDEVRPDWLGIFLGWHNQRPPTRISERIYLNNGSTQSHAYIIRRHGLWRMLDHLWVKQFDIVDWAYCDMMNNDSAFFQPDKQMITTREGISDNGQGWKPQGT